MKITHSDVTEVGRLSQGTKKKKKRQKESKVNLKTKQNYS